MQFFKHRAAGRAPILTFIATQEDGSRASGQYRAICKTLSHCIQSATAQEVPEIPEGGQRTHHLATHLLSDGEQAVRMCQKDTVTPQDSVDIPV